MQVKIEVKTGVYENWEFDLNGHYYGCSPQIIQNIFSTDICLALLDTPGKKRLLRRSCLRKCNSCGEDLALQVFPRKGLIKILGRKCKMPEGAFPLDCELNVRSGKMVFANDLRSIFQVVGSYDVNIDHGKYQTMKEYEKIGMIHGFVGNSCPSIYKVSRKNLTISKRPSEEDWNGQEWVSVPKKVFQRRKPKGRRVGAIGTDLWWYCIVDLEEMRKRWTDLGIEEDFEEYLRSNDCTVVSVKPGVYNVRHFRRYEYNNKFKHYAKISWKRKPDERADFEARLNVDFTASELMVQTIMEYPTLFFREADVDWGSRRTSDCDLFERLSPKKKIEYLSNLPKDRWVTLCQRYANDIFLTGGGRMDWHKNGWAHSSPPVRLDFKGLEEKLKIPVFDKRYIWYGVDRCCALSRAVGAHDQMALRIYGGKTIYLNKSFRYLAFNVLYSILKHGGDFSTRELKDLNENYMENARLMFVKLCEMYPDDIPAFCKDL